MILELLDEYSSALTLLFSAVVATSTVIYAILTRNLVSETRRMRKAQIKPHVSVTYGSTETAGSSGFLDMVIQNVGEGAAYDLQFTVYPEFEFEFKLSEIGFIKNGLPYLGPNQKIKFFLTSLYQDYKQKEENPFTVKVTYKDKIGEPYSEEYLIDFSQLSGLSQLGTPPLITIANSVEKIERNIGHLSSGFHKLNVITQTKDEVRKEEDKWFEERKKKLNDFSGK